MLATTSANSAGQSTFFETWLPLPDAPEYQVSDLGRVRKHGSVLKKSVRNRGRPYEFVNLQIGGRPTYRLVHRLVLTAFLGFPPAGHVCCHRDDNPRNNRLDNLYWGTQKQNMLDAFHNDRLNRWWWPTEKGMCFDG